MYLRKLILQRAEPSLQPKEDCSWPTQAAILTYGATTLPPNLTKQLRALSIKYKTFDFSKNRERQIKQLQKWLPHNSSLCVDVLALSFVGRESDLAEASIEMSVLRLALTQALQKHTTGLRWLSCTAMGRSAFSTASSESSEKKATPDALLLGGATTGFVKSAMRELNVWNRCVDIVSEAPKTWLRDELQDTTSHLEVLYDGDARYITTFSTQTAAQTLPTMPKDLGIGHRAGKQPPVIMISGGGSGITATITESLAKLMSFRVVILGRTMLPDISERLPLKNKAEARKILRSKLGEEATPKRIQEELRRAEKQDNLRKQIERYKQLGVKSLLIPTDMNDLQAVERAVQQTIATWGQVDAVIHGAGVDQSRDLVSKTPEEVRFVMSVKLKGLANLHQALSAHHVKAWLAFGSVSSRFGNIGQVDYAAANEAMARWLIGDEDFQQALLIDYTAWDKVGMAATLAKFMIERGVDILPPQPTASHTATLWYHGAQGEWVYSGRLPEEETPLGQIQLRVPGTEVRYERSLQTGQIKFLEDHKMGNTEIQPGVVSLAWMLLAAQEVGEGTLYREIRDVRFNKALKLFPGKTAIMKVNALRAEANSETPASVQATVSSQRERRGSIEQLDHASATFVPVPLEELHSSEEALNPTRLERSTLQEDHNIASIYDTFFHGPTWQVLGQAWYGDDTAITTLHTHDSALGQGLPDTLRHNAVGQELVLQTAGLWGLRKKGLFVLPFAIKQVIVHCDAQPSEPKEAHIQFVKQNDDQLIFHAHLLGQDQRLLQTFRHLSMRIFPIPT